jgi:hypothetical protein
MTYTYLARIAVFFGIAATVGFALAVRERSQKR